MWIINYFDISLGTLVKNLPFLGKYTERVIKPRLQKVDQFIVGSYAGKKNYEHYIL